MIEIVLFCGWILCMILFARYVEEVKYLLLTFICLLPSELCILGIVMLLEHRLWNYLKIIQAILIMDFILFFYYMIACLLARLGYRLNV